MMVLYRQKHLFTALTAFIFCFSVVSVSADEDGITTVAVTDRIAMLEGRGGNIGVLHGPDGMIMIDDKFLDLSDQIKSALTALNSGKVRFLLNTHWHHDHTGGNRAFAAETTIISHKNVRKLLSADQVIEAFNKTVEATPESALPILTFSESVQIHFNGETADIVHLPDAHTSGDSYVHFVESDVIHTGDLFFNGFFPFIDVEHGGSINGYISAVEHLISVSKETTRIIPGHGPLASKADLESFLKMLKASRRFVEESIRLGSELEDIIATGLSDEWDPWKDGFLKEDKWLTIVFNSLNKGD